MTDESSATATEAPKEAATDKPAEPFGRKVLAFLKAKRDDALSFGKGALHAARAAPGYLKVHAPLLFNPKRLYNLYRMGGHTQGVDAAWHKRLSAGVAAYPLAVTATAAALFFLAPAALPIVLLMTLAPVPVLLKLNYDVYEAQKEVVTRRNAAGQDVTGARQDIYALHRVQRKIFKLTKRFNDGAVPPQVQKKVAAALADAAGPRGRVVAGGELAYKFAGLPATPAKLPPNLLSHGAGKIVPIMQTIRREKKT
jgi:hypothetical protein